MNTKVRLFNYFLCLKNRLFQFLIWSNREVIKFITNGYFWLHTFRAKPLSCIRTSALARTGQ